VQFNPIDGGPEFNGSRIALDRESTGWVYWVYKLKYSNTATPEYKSSNNFSIRSNLGGYIFRL